MKFTKTEFNNFRNDIKKAVELVEKKYGVEIQFGSISYSDTSFKIKTEVINGGVEVQMKQEYLKWCKSYGLEEEDYGKTFDSKGRTFKLVGLDANRPKYPIVCQGEDGSNTLFTRSIIERIRTTEI